jgi:hypothetical protein
MKLEAKNDLEGLELALLRVRHRHEAAGDAHKMTFGDLLMEACEEARAEEERLARGEDFTARYGMDKKRTAREARH